MVFFYLNFFEKVLFDIIFFMNVGEILGIIGGIGFGKLILVNLLFYIYKV